MGMAAAEEAVAVAAAATAVAEATTEAAEVRMVAQMEEEGRRRSERRHQLLW